MWITIEIINYQFLIFAGKLSDTNSPLFDRSMFRLEIKCYLNIKLRSINIFNQIVVSLPFYQLINENEV